MILRDLCSLTSNNAAGAINARSATQQAQPLNGPKGANSTRAAHSTVLRILMLAPTPYFSDRGCHVRIYEEAKALLARGHRVEIVTYHLGRDLGDIPVTRTATIPWYRKLSAGPSWHKPCLDLLLLFKSLSVARRFRPDIVHAHLHEGAFIAALARRWFRVPIVFDCQGSLCGELIDHGFCRRGGLLNKLFAALEGWITRRADHIVTSSTNTAELVRSQLPEVATRLTPLADAVDTDTFKPCGKDAELLRDLAVPAGRKLIVYLGAMTTYQGVDLLLEALVELAATRDDFHLLLMGYPDTAYREQADRLGLPGRVTFTGKLAYADAPRYLSLGDIAVSPKLSATEANGKLLNYMACGLPGVAFDTAVNRELLGDSGVYVAERTPAGFAAGIASLLDDPARCAELSQRSRELAVHSHSWKARIESLQSVYESLLNKPEG
jgi:glycosyltransferase involved in cell wall biosynthesis